jgi:hypothetical protein
MDRSGDLPCRARPAGAPGGGKDAVFDRFPATDWRARPEAAGSSDDGDRSKNRRRRTDVRMYTYVRRATALQSPGTASSAQPLRPRQFRYVHCTGRALASGHTSRDLRLMGSESESEQ